MSMDYNTVIDISSRTSHLRSAAHREQRAGQMDTAIELYERHLRDDPDDQTAWFELGSAMRQEQQFEQAMFCYQRGLKIHPDTSVIWAAMGALWRDMEQYQQSLRAYYRAISLEPERLDYQYNLAVTLNQACLFDKALDAIGECLAREPRNPEFLLERARIQLYQQNYADGMRDLEIRTSTLRPDESAPDCPRWRGENPEGCKILVRAEPQFSETLRLVRYLWTLANRGAHLTFACSEDLHPILKAIPARLICDELRYRERIEEDWDYYCGLQSLPYLLDSSGQLIPDPVEITTSSITDKRFSDLIDTNQQVLKVGIVWCGNRHHPDNHKHRVQLEHFSHLAHLPGVQLVSLQKGGAANDLYDCDWSNRITDLGMLLQDFGEAAGVLNALNILVTVDTAVAHLAANMNKPVINLLHYRPDWIYGLQSIGTPWYPTMRLIRQPEPGDWHSVFEQVNHMIEAMSNRYRKLTLVKPNGQTT